MTETEVREFLSQTGRRSLGLGTLEADGWPAGTMAPFAYLDGKLLFEIPREGLAFQNIQRDDRVCCMIEDAGKAGYYGTRCVVARGSARRVEGELEALRRGASPSTSGDSPSSARAQQSQHALLAIPVDDVWSFDFGKMRARF